MSGTSYIKLKSSGGLSETMAILFIARHDLDGTCTFGRSSYLERKSDYGCGVLHRVGLLLVAR